MLRALSVRDLLIVDRLDVELAPGLCVLTGETGAGKSILLDALGVALGARADTGLLRPGADRAHVAAEFELPLDHPALRLAEENGVDADGATLVLRRALGRDGRSRASLNDQPVSAGLLRKAGALMVEVQGQNETRGLLDPATHCGFLDAFAGIEADASDVAARWAAWSERRAALAVAENEAARSAADRDYVGHAAAELEELSPEAGEGAQLSAERARLRDAEQLASSLAAGADALSGGDGPAARLATAERMLARGAATAADRLAPVLAALARASAEAAEAEAALASAIRDLSPDPARLERVEERLFGLRAMARKHRVDVDALVEVREGLADRLRVLEGGTRNLASLRDAAADARDVYRKSARALGARRAAAAAELDRVVTAELAPLKLRAAFRTAVAELDEADWGRGGSERVRFEVRTNPGHPAGPLHRVASGGELGRFLLALRVVLSRSRPAPVLIFDEVDRGLGGATADAVGERLAELGREGQVLVVTHSPQVAARADAHWRVEKRDTAVGAAVRVTALDGEGRREEIARMLAGARVTQEARAAADRLIAAPELAE